MIAKTAEEIKNLREAGKILGDILRTLAHETKPGVKTATLDLRASELIEKKGARSAFLGYKPEGAAYPFPAALCVSINDEVVHGIPREDCLIQEGDVVMLDLGLSYKGYFADAAVTVIAGEGDGMAKKLVESTREALSAAIQVAKPGNTTGDIGAAIAAVAKKYGLGVVEELGGHSLGLVPHEAPFVPNAAKPGTGETLVEGLILAIEPIFAEGKGDIVLAEDEWTYHTKDGSRSAEFEHTVLITKDGAEILTA